MKFVDDDDDDDGNDDGLVTEDCSDSDVANLIQEMEVMKIIGPHRNVLNLLGCCTQDGTHAPSPFLNINSRYRSNLARLYRRDLLSDARFVIDDCFILSSDHRNMRNHYRRRRREFQFDVLRYSSSYCLLSYMYTKTQDTVFVRGHTT